MPPGASSTGSATAVSVGMGIVSIGTDTAGSILFPASAQSLVGLKPSFGLVPAERIYPGLTSHHDVAGPIARTVRDTAAVLDVIASDHLVPAGGYEAVLKKGALQGRRIGLFEPGIWAAELHPKVWQHYERMIAVLGRLGAQNNPASRSEFKARAGFELGLGNTAPLRGLLSNPAINDSAGSPAMLEVIAQADSLYEHYREILASKQIDMLFLPRSINPLPDLNGKRSICRQFHSDEES